MNILKIFFEFMKAYPYYTFVNIIMMLLIPVNDVYLSDKYGKLFESLNDGKFEFSHFATILVIMIILQIGWGIDDVNSSKQTPDFQHFCRKKIINHIFKKLDTNFGDLLTGDLISKILRSEHILTSWYNRIFSYLIPYTLELLIAIYLIFKMDKSLGLTLILVAIVFIVTLLSSPNSCSDNYNDRLNNNIHEEVDDILSNYQTIFKNDTLPKELNRLDTFSDIYKHKLMRTIKCTIKYRVVQSILIMGFLTFFIYRSFYLLKNSKIEKAIFYTSLIVMKQVIGNFIHAIDMCRDATVEWDILQYTGFFNTNDLYKNRKKESVKPSCKNTEIVDKNVLLDMQNVSFKYSKQKNYILENVNWSVSRGDKIALVGDIGSGKSTLLKLILKIINPVKGRIQVCRFLVTTIFFNGISFSEIMFDILTNFCFPYFQFFQDF